MLTEFGENIRHLQDSGYLARQVAKAMGGCAGRKVAPKEVKTISQRWAVDLLCCGLWADRQLAGHMQGFIKADKNKGAAK